MNCGSNTKDTNEGIYRSMGRGDITLNPAPPWARHWSLWPYSNLKICKEKQFIKLLGR